MTRRGYGILVPIVVVWLLIGVLAAGQRHYFKDSTQTCAKASTIAVTIVAGPLNYLGLNPKLSCDLPQPSK
ncbi:hypothetical protein SAMN05892883_0612 [Jatrophihabitans sp. GAS493]|uniref:hypothetical protein n=1 Tax=Jatrophihabitans sp. GAS493 TaxID=1907575 RepID=UPI000BB861A6|nr:hypothetical protein [Jatrophihabitans sp. GAS493]SOD71005.1 hypothetical protein SAMN05892883_0612 [Jatrophihabitans sp. GAS493]